ncbi:MAG: hypothetical protein Q8O04_03495 [Deltaproteobacteria bacterium]|nr:hypothetical protein [Deltaproteobacteria bacterium]
MSGHSLTSLAEYSRCVAEILDHPDVQGSTVAVWSDSPYTGTAEGEVFFSGGIRLRMREELDFDAGLITSYGYEVHDPLGRCFSRCITYLFFFVVEVKMAEIILKTDRLDMAGEVLKDARKYVTKGHKK